jgi:hypothetical protein
MNVTLRHRHAGLHPKALLLMVLERRNVPIRKLVTTSVQAASSLALASTVPRTSRSQSHHADGEKKSQFQRVVDGQKDCIGDAQHCLPNPALGRAK